MKIYTPKIHNKHIVNNLFFVKKNMILFDAVPVIIIKKDEILEQRYLTNYNDLTNI